MATQKTTEEHEEQDVESSDEYATGDTAECEKTEAVDSRYETVDAQRQAEVLERDEYQCRVCGRRGPERGGLATLHIHHLERDPNDKEEHDPQNLTTLCRGCHNWIHQRATPTKSPVSLTEADLSVLLPHDIEILRVLAESGPARTGEIADRLSIELSVTATRERLWLLMGLDRMVASRDQQVVDQDVETGEWGLVGQIETSARGHIPDDPQALLQRIEDEQVREALERGVDRDAIMDVLDMSRRSTFYKQKRACAYGFPLDAFRRGEDGVVKRDSPERDARVDEGGERSDGQQRLEMVAENEGESLEKTEEWGAFETESDAGSTRTKQANGTVKDRDESCVTDAVETELQEAINALQQVNDAL